MTGARIPPPSALSPLVISSINIDTLSNTLLKIRLLLLFYHSYLPLQKII